jgi:hypothetical protein
MRVEIKTCRSLTFWKFMIRDIWIFQMLRLSRKSWDGSVNWEYRVSKVSIILSQRQASTGFFIHSNDLVRIGQAIGNAYPTAEPISVPGFSERSITQALQSQANM